MSGTTLYLLAVGAGAVGRWANSKPFTARTVVGAVFGGIVIAALDSGSSAGVARGLAALVLVSVLLGASSPLEALNKVKGKP